jgi:hypothetical protein
VYLALLVAYVGVIKHMAGKPVDLSVAPARRPAGTRSAA